ncbi:hypothetical protein QE152_g32535 [Popillia japonica]|uniref:Uncharacterized protein n=1 Tax=Popillia japonica TaxID=7064 RepID=A0AAW1IZ11_POPJA
MTKLPVLWVCCRAHLYAEDVQFYYSFKAIDWMETTRRINEDLLNVYSMSAALLLKINPAKLQVLVFGNRDSVNALSERLDIQVNNLKVPVVASV